LSHPNGHVLSCLFSVRRRVAACFSIPSDFLQYISIFLPIPSKISHANFLRYLLRKHALARRRADFILSKALPKKCNSCLSSNLTIAAHHPRTSVLPRPGLAHHEGSGDFGDPIAIDSDSDTATIQSTSTAQAAPTEQNLLNDLKSTVQRYQAKANYCLGGSIPISSACVLLCLGTHHLPARDAALRHLARLRQSPRSPSQTRQTTHQAFCKICYTPVLLPPSVSMAKMSLMKPIERRASSTSHNSASISILMIMA